MVESTSQKKQQSRLADGRPKDKVLAAGAAQSTNNMALRWNENVLHF